MASEPPTELAWFDTDLKAMYQELARVRAEHSKALLAWEPVRASLPAVQRELDMEAQETERELQVMVFRMTVSLFFAHAGPLAPMLRVLFEHCDDGMGSYELCNCPEVA
jgi:hypothetical protein